jgi:hypoxanthine phosphoribosyltransferase
MTDAAPPDAETSPAAGASHATETPPEPPTAGAVTAPTGTDAAGRPWPPFAHGSETEMARILDFYEVRWEYEPRTFPILWNLDGDVVESFSPDFYLPDLDLFLEMTTLKQRLVRKKNRKLRRLRELYPDIRIKLFYARDFRAMMLKYGRLALADSMSGTLGQVMPDRGREPDLDMAAAALEAAALEVGGSAVRPTPVDTSADDVAAGSIPAPLPARHAGEAAPRSEGPAGVRRNASRSRRRRAAAAARAVARGIADASLGEPTTRAEEVRRSR